MLIIYLINIIIIFKDKNKKVFSIFVVSKRLFLGAAITTVIDHIFSHLARARLYVRVCAILKDNKCWTRYSAFDCFSCCYISINVAPNVVVRFTYICFFNVHTTINRIDIKAITRIAYISNTHSNA